MTPKESANIKLIMSEPMPPGPEVPAHRGWWQKAAELVARPGTTLDITGVREGYTDIGTFATTYNGVQMALRAYRAEKEGYDAFIIGCSTDMGLKECRALANIPVIGPTEATALLAATLGNKFSTFVFQPLMIPVTENAIKSAGVMDKCASVRCPPGLTAIKNSTMIASGKEDELLEMYTKEMSKAVNEDGAEVLFISCVPTSTWFYTKGVREVDGAPVLDQFSVSLKLAEMLVDLKRAYGTDVCRRSIYVSPPDGWEKQVPSIMG
jgi:allantoin racemase